MDVTTTPTLQQLLRTADPASGGAPSLRIGQLLQALSQGYTRDGLLQLLIGRQLLLARTEAQLDPAQVAPGKTLTLQVERTGDAPELRLLLPATPAAVKAEALRQALPRMLELAPALERLLADGGSRSAPLDEPTRALVQQLVRQLPNAEAVSDAGGLRAAVRRSGLFPEAMMARGEVPSPDVKTLLLRLAVRLRNEAPASPGKRGETAGAAPRAAATARGGNLPSTGSATAPAASTPSAANRPAATPAPAPPRAPPDPKAEPASGRSAGTSTAGGKPDSMTTANARPAAPSGANAKPPAPASADAEPTAPASAGDKQSAAANADGKASAAATVSRPPAAGGAGTPAPSPAKVAEAVPPLPPSPSSAADTAPGPGSPNQASAPATPAPAQGRPAPTAQGAPNPPPADPSPARDGAAAHRTGTSVPRLVQDLARQVEGALSRLQFNQVSSLPQGDGSHQAWQLDLPVRNGDRVDGFQLRVEEERRNRGAAGAGSSWTVNLAFTLEPLGPVRVRIGLLGESVSSTFWAEHPATADLIGRRLEELRRGFERAGLEVGQLAARMGVPAAPRSDADADPLVDAKA